MGERGVDVESGLQEGKVLHSVLICRAGLVQIGVDRFELFQGCPEVFDDLDGHLSCNVGIVSNA